MSCPNIDLGLLIKNWQEWDKNKDTLQEINTLVEKQEWEKLNKIMVKRLEFGTAGIRGRMGAGFGQMNDLVIIQVTQGLLAHLKTDDSELSSKGVVFGYDGRYNSARWASLAAGVFLRAGVPVYLFQTTVPTPFVPFTVLQKRAAAGVMVTASHNPKWDNGYKVYWGNGAQILSPHDKNIQAAILENLEPQDGAFDVPDPNHELLSNPWEEINSKYFTKLPIYNEKKMNSSLQCSVVYTAMHGVGCPYVVQSWAAAGFDPKKLVIVEEQKDPDPEFSTVDFPNPEEGASALDLSFQKADSCGAKYILANDPDADRLGVAQKQKNAWKILNGNEIGALLGWWLLKCFKAKSPDYPLDKVHLLASTVSSKILNTIAKKEGVNFTETLTGFKHMGNQSDKLLKDDDAVLFAYEEAIGFMCGTEVLDKDGVSAVAVIGELIAYLETKEMDLTDQLKNIYKIYGYHFTLNSYYLCYDPAVTNKIFERIRHFSSGSEEASYPSSVCGGKYKVVGVRDLTTGYDDTKADKKATLPVSKSSHMITFWLDNGVVITLRTSGTEPKIKYYTEFCAPPENDDWEAVETELAEIVKQVVQELFQPDLNKLTPKPL
eukprot:TRINITY_DN19678_c0_g1_i1.p1 TRINITY_DN19678_c0_g1~~TRINITY_DN19678_c0_g1_i1.p1  ORF type:complete len:603 (+),score=181.19 TRINITY_DN19678_c0_g1_i1:153-1961(+)